MKPKLNLLHVFLLTLNLTIVLCQLRNDQASYLNAFSSYRINDNTYVLTSKRHNITCYSGRVLYPYGPECADIELSKDLTRSNQINLGFNLTLMGHKFEKAWINQHGLISFQESFLGQTLSQEDWPHPKYPYVDDPVFIAPLYAQNDLAGDKIEDLTETKYGRVLYKVIKRMDLPIHYTEEEKFVYQMTMKILDEAQKQIRESVASGEEFIATHALISTWKSVAFLGNSLIDIDQRPVRIFFRF